MSCVKSIEERWEEFIQPMSLEDVHPEVVRSLKSLFFAGALSSLGLVISAVVKLPEDEILPELRTMYETIQKHAGLK